MWLGEPGASESWSDMGEPSEGAQKVRAPALSHDTRGVPCGLQLHACTLCAPLGFRAFTSCPCFSVCTAWHGIVHQHPYGPKTLHTNRDL